MLVSETSTRPFTIPSPRDLGLPHDAWRRHQYETYLWLSDDNRNPVNIIEQPTGSGKSAVVSALANHGRTVIITKTKSLQQQYASIYGAFPMMGKSNRCQSAPTPTTASISWQNTGQ